MRLSCSKTYTDIPFAHRQHKHDGHCALIHGHNWSFEFEFAAERLDPCGFVIDFGKLKWLKQWIEAKFDHALVLNEDDPHLRNIQFFCERADQSAEDEPEPYAKITVVPDCSCEGLAVYLLKEVAAALQDIPTGKRGVRLIRVTVYEDSKNSATVRAD